MIMIRTGKIRIDLFLPILFFPSVGVAHDSTRSRIRLYFFSHDGKAHPCCIQTTWRRLFICIIIRSHAFQKYFFLQRKNGRQKVLTADAMN